MWWSVLNRCVYPNCNVLSSGLFCAVGFSPPSPSSILCRPSKKHLLSIRKKRTKKEKLMHKLIDPALPITKTPPTENVLFQPWKYHANTYLKKKILFSTWKKKTEVLCCPEKRKNKNPMHLKNLDWKIARHPSRQQLWSRRMIIISQFLLRTKALCRRMREKSICLI